MGNYNCPRCQKEISLDTKNKFRPFCSDKCQNYDLGEWSLEKYTIFDKSSSLPTAEEIIYNEEVF